MITTVKGVEVRTNHHNEVVCMSEWEQRTRLLDDGVFEYRHSATCKCGDCPVYLAKQYRKVLV